MMRSRLAGRVAALLLGTLSGAVAAATPARAEVLTSDERGFVVRQTVDVGVSAPEVWRVLVKPATWWSGEHTFSGEAANLTLDPVAGGCFCEKLPPSKQGGAAAQAGSVQHMRVVYAEPGRALRLTGALGPLQSEALLGALTITLKSNERGTRILFEYVVGGYMRYRPDQIAPAVDRMLGQQIAGLANKLGGALAAGGPVPIFTPPAPDGNAQAGPAAAPTVRALPQGPSLSPDGAPISGRVPGALRGLPVLPHKRTTMPTVDADDQLSVPDDVASGAASLQSNVPAKAAPSRPVTKPAVVEKAKPAPAKDAPGKPAAAKPAPAKPPAAKPAGMKALPDKPAPPKPVAKAARPAQPTAPRDEVSAQKDAQAAFDAALGQDNDH